MSWIVIPNWDKLQHYTDRDPPWIKFYTSVNSDDDWCQLSLAARGLLVTLWAEYARSRGQLCTSAIPAVCRQKVLRKTLVSLNDAGLIQLSASKPLALTRSREAEKKREEKTGSANAQKSKPAGPRSNAAAYQPFQDNGTTSYIPLEQIETYLQELSGKTTRDMS